MSTELSNGVIIPEEYSDDWYDEMSINLRKLNDVITAASDNATDIQRLDTDKANSSDLATVATSGSYTDLTDKPTINDSTITIQKNGSTVDTFTTNGSAKTINIPVPTKTSDLTNDSNFVDTSNAAVSSGITSAKVTDYDTHITDTDIHVTTADKNKWNNQTYVFRYSSTALTPSSTNSNTLLDNTDNLKVGDKVIDSSGVLFSITAIDTANSTFTIGTALIDLAQDSDVVHKSGNETISGFKTFSSTIRLTAYPNIRMYLPDDEWNVQPATAKQSEIRFTDKNSVTISYFAFQHRPNSTEPFRTCWRQQKMDGTNGYYSIAFGNLGNFYPENDITITLGTQSSRWKGVYAQNYYYGLNNVEFSTKFVTTDTAQTISGNKTFSSINGVEPSSLSLPDLNNGIDISSYITHLDKGVNQYTPPSNGWLSIRVRKASLTHTSLMMSQTGGLLSSCETAEFSISGIILPVIANKNVDIYIIANSLESAKFYPCQGNV